MTQTTGSAEHLLCLWHKQQVLLKICCVCDTSNRVCADSSEVSCQEMYDFVDLCLNTNFKKITCIHLLDPYMCCVSCDYVCLFACRHGSYIFYLPSTGTRKQGKLVKPTLGHTIMIITNYIYKPPFLTRDIYEAPSLTRAHSALQVLTTYN